jgi:predicted nucleic acid-binding protein
MSKLEGVDALSTLALNLQSSKPEKLFFIDTTVLFAQTYPLDSFHDEVTLAFDALTKAQASVFTNVNVRAEFLENHRRILIAECLIDLLEDHEGSLDGVLIEKLKSHRTSYRRKVAEQRSAKIEIQQIKIFRRLLSAHQGPSGNGWEIFCRDRLNGQIEKIWDAAEDELGLNFISLRSEDKTPFLNSRPDWRDATSLIGRYGIASADAMILNMFLCSKIPALITADVEMAECAIKESKGSKRVFVPDSLFAD